MQSKKTLSNLMLLLTAIIWGSAFVAQRMGMDHIGPFAFNGIRSILGSLALLPILHARYRGKRLPQGADRRMTIVGGVCCGIVLFGASGFQQFGVAQTTAGKAGFITAIYIILTPVFGLFLRRTVTPAVWLAVALATAGLYFLCFIPGSEPGQALSFETGDLLVFISAFLFTAHILVIDHFSPRVDGVLMSFIQFIIAGVLGLACMLLFERPALSAILSGWAPLLYAGILSSGVGYTLQIVAQKHVNPAVASLLLSLEAVFAALAGRLILGESFLRHEFIGMALMFAAIILSQLPEEWLLRRRNA